MQGFESCGSGLGVEDYGIKGVLLTNWFWLCIDGAMQVAQTFYCATPSRPVFFQPTNYLEEGLRFGDITRNNGEPNGNEECGDIQGL